MHTQWNEQLPAALAIVYHAGILGFRDTTPSYDVSDRVEAHDWLRSRVRVPDLSPRRPSGERADRPKTASLG